MRLDTQHRRARYTQIGVPAAFLGVLASTFGASSATAAVPVRPADTGAHERLTALPKLVQANNAVRSDTVVPATVVPTAVVPANAAPATYTVQSGDTISSIASKFGFTTLEVLTWNGLSWRSVIYPGQEITLTAFTGAPATEAAPAPAPAPSAVTHTVVAGDTIFAIAQKYGSTVGAILAANGLSPDSVIYPGQVITIPSADSPAPVAVPPAIPAAPAPTPAPAPAPAGTTHTVVAGDTLFAIAQKYGTTVSALYAANGLGPSSIIYPGQTIIISAPPAAAPAPAATPTPAATPAPALTAALNAPQAENATMIIRIGRDLGVSERGIAIALATSMVESWLRNLDWGDRDSLGLFQQRPSTGWGTPDQIMDRDRSIRVFFGGPSDPNGQITRGLLDVPGWESMPFSDAAQSVQISAFPERYGQWEAAAYEWIALYG